jgi:hypothetical protein
LNNGRARKHSALIKEVFAPDPERSEFIVCQGQDDIKCSAGVPCGDKSWAHHSEMAGVMIKSLILQIIDPPCPVEVKVGSGSVALSICHTAVYLILALLYLK